MKKAVMFDFDGVLTTDATGTTSIMKYIEKETHINREKFESVYRKRNHGLLYGELKHESVWSEICEEMSERISIQVLYDSFIATPLDEDMFDLLRDLKGNGYLIGMITDNKRDRIDQILDHYKLRGLFDVITISADIGSGKKNEDIFDVTLKEVKLRYEDCVIIDNNKENLVVPENKGMSTVFYDHEVRDINKLKKELSDLGFVIKRN